MNDSDRTLEIKCVDSGGTFVIANLSDESWRAFLKLPSLDAEVSISVYVHGDTLQPFFADLANCWRGWEGSKVWKSLEGELCLSASADSFGHISLRVALRSVLGHHPFRDWLVEGTIMIDSGSLNDLATSSASVFS